MSGWPVDPAKALELQAKIVALTRVQLEAAGVDMTKPWAVIVMVDPDPSKGSIKMIG